MNTFRVRVRRWLMVLLSVAVLGVFVARLMRIQIVDSEAYKNMIGGSRISTQTVKATRGEIVDRSGNPLVVNRMGYDVVIDRAFFPSDRQNEILQLLIELFESVGEEWNDSLPITEAEPFAFKPGYESDVEKLRAALDAQPYATAEDMLYWLSERYKLEGYTPAEQRKIAGVRYEMELRGFALNVPFTFASGVDISTVVRVKERGYELSGVDAAETAIRQIQDGTLAPHLIGTVGPIYYEEYDAYKELGYAMDDTVGKEGVERAFESYLRGANGKREIFIGAEGEVVTAVESTPPVPGNTVMLTLDSGLQRLAQDALEAQIKNLQATEPAGMGKEADSGAVVMLNAKTGELLAAANYPSYDLTTYRQNYAALVGDTALTPLVNRALMGVYAPGSTFKPCVAVAGLSSGAITESSVVHCGKVYTYYPGGYQPTCLDYHGGISLNRALSLSCNIFFYDTGRVTGIDRIEEIAHQLGLGLPTGIELPESLGMVSSPAAKEADPNNTEPWYAGDVLQSSIGQLYNWFSPLQLANYAATIGNRGERMQVTVVREIRDYSMHEVVEPFTPKVAGRVDADREVFEAVVSGMVSASRSGTARRYFGAYPFDVASKTGTPQTFDLPNSTFITFAPADDPQIAIAVVIEKGWHGYTGAPVAKALYNAYFGIDQTSTLPPALLGMPSYTAYFPERLPEPPVPAEPAAQPSGEAQEIPQPGGASAPG